MDAFEVLPGAFVRVVDDAKLAGKAVLRWVLVRRKVEKLVVLVLSIFRCSCVVWQFFIAQVVALLKQSLQSEKHAIRGSPSIMKTVVFSGESFELSAIAQAQQ